ncbi:Translocation protein SEC62 [Spraguea lophii 42_110]|uniref:Translocation protein SEC62 n=1 Tax=Spraguea lophii (strain 42_110) TaxID=1358809 RepID=S7WAM9_SPRLO|nr:Translocation protein SEC62 [Spraguea lophii 42_110]
MHKLNDENLLRSLAVEEKILDGEKRVHTFEGSTAYEFLKGKNLSDTEIIEYMNYLITNHIIVRGIKMDKKNCVATISKKFKKENMYIWVEKQKSHLNLLLSIILILVTLFIVMYQVWPQSLRKGAAFILFPTMGFLGFIGCLGVIRLIIFGITFFTNPPGIWLFPNLFADVGFIDSFIPVWEYSGIDTKPKNKEE